MSIASYKQAKDLLDTVSMELGAVASLLSDVADALTHHPDGLRIAGATSLPPLSALAPSFDAIMIDPFEWPSFSDIQAMLLEWRHRQIDAHAQWQRLTQAERKGLVPPDMTSPLVRPPAAA